MSASEAISPTAHYTGYGQVHLHLSTGPEAVQALRVAGFTRASVMRASELAPGPRGHGSNPPHILEASTT